MCITVICGRNSAVECQLPKLKVAGSNPVARSITAQQDPNEYNNREHRISLL